MNGSTYDQPIYYDPNTELADVLKQVKVVGIKLDAGKPSISLIPSEYINGTAEVFNFGGKKYGLHNYRKGLGHSRCLDAALRHIFAILQGEELDPESGLEHVFHASCSLAMYVYQQRYHPELNDIYEMTKNMENTNDKR